VGLLLLTLLLAVAFYGMLEIGVRLEDPFGYE
jgi:predicted membrane chloride channel (bestrophin family)